VRISFARELGFAEARVVARGRFSANVRGRPSIGAHFWQ
jgi:hypothetical protein